MKPVFHMTEEQTMLSDMLSRLLSQPTEDPWRRFADQGVIGALFTEKHGGYAGSGSDLAVVFEQIGRAADTTPLIDCALLPGYLMAEAGYDLAPLINGEQHYAVAHTEAHAHYDLHGVETIFSNGTLNGEKSVVIGADSAQQILITARDGDNIAIYLVNADSPGIRYNHYELTHGGHGADLLLSQVPATPLAGNAIAALEKAWAAALVAQCADTLGAMEIASQMTRDYLMTREQFGRPLSSFQALAHRITDIMLAIEQARSAVLLAAAHLNNTPKERDKHGAACKNLMGRMGRLVAEECIQLHGGIGMTDEYALGNYGKRIIMADHRFGDTDYHLERFIAFTSESSSAMQP